MDALTLWRARSAAPLRALPCRAAPWSSFCCSHTASPMQTTPETASPLLLATYACSKLLCHGGNYANESQYSNYISVTKSLIIIEKEIKIITHQLWDPPRRWSCPAELDQQRRHLSCGMTPSRCLSWTDWTGALVAVLFGVSLPGASER